MAATGIELERTPGSGSWGRMQTKGDLIASEEDRKRWPYFVECKKVEGWDLWNQLFSGEGPMFEWWNKACDQAKEEHKVPLLIFAQNRREILLMAAYNKSYKLPLNSVIIPHAGVFITPIESWIKWVF